MLVRNDYYHYTIYHKHPRFQNQFIVLKLCINSAQVDQMWVEDSLDRARSHVPSTQVRFLPDPGDDPTILEIWV